MFDYNVYALTGDGCMMEGVTSEAASLAGHLKLSKLCWIYDNNKITIEGPTELAFSEDVATRFMGYGWRVTHVEDANDRKALERAFESFKETDNRPTLIIVDSHIAYGAPHKQDTSSAHGVGQGELPSILTVDLYVKQFNPSMTPRKEAMMGRVISVIVILFMAILAFYPPSLLFSSLIDFTYPGLVAIVPATILGMYWRRVSTPAAIASIIGGSLVAVYVLTHKNPMGLYSGFWSLAVSLVILVVVTLIVPSKEETFLPETVTYG